MTLGLERWLKQSKRRKRGEEVDGEEDNEKEMMNKEERREWYVMQKMKELE